MATRLRNLIGDSPRGGRAGGLAGALKSVASRAAKRVLRVEVSEMLWASAEQLRQAACCDATFEFRFLTVDEVEALVADGGSGLLPEFVARAAGGRDLCFAALEENGRVAHYGWYALGSIEGRHHVGVEISFPPGMAYMYNAFTHSDYRGQRLHGIAMALAMEQLAGDGVKRLISNVEWTNVASMRSFKRMNFARLGRLWTIGRGERRWYLAPKAAKNLGVRFGDDAVVQPRDAAMLETVGLG